MRDPGKRRLGAVLLTLAMLLSLLPAGAVTALAAEKYRLYLGGDESHIEKVGVTVDGGGEGEISIHGAVSVEAGQTVGLRFTPVEGYAIGSVTCSYQDESGFTGTVEVAEADGVYSFTMPEYDAEVEASAQPLGQWLAQRIQAGGEVRLPCDVTYENNASYLNSSSDVTVDLNGMSLTCGCLVPESGVMTLTGGGLLNGNVQVGFGEAAFVLDGCAIHGVVSLGGTFIMSDGTITDVDEYSYAVGLSEYGGVFRMNGGSIAGNQGGGVEVPASASASFLVSGDVTVAGNTCRPEEDGAVLPEVARNVYLHAGKVIEVEGALAETARIGVTAETGPTAGAPVVITSGLNGRGAAVNFFSDSDDYSVRVNSSGEAELYVPGSSYSVTVAEGDGTGTVTAEPASAVEGTPVTLTV
ncbi:MAG: hypothetical protein IKD79_07525, partial [Oscillospiraceae bacterium]|nr:hypothetical protein [Oscillospiraceae bacterium]